MSLFKNKSTPYAMLAGCHSQPLQACTPCSGSCSYSRRGTHDPLTAMFAGNPKGWVQTARREPCGANPDWQARSQVSPNASGQVQLERSAPGSGSVAHVDGAAAASSAAQSMVGRVQRISISLDGSNRRPPLHSRCVNCSADPVPMDINRQPARHIGATTGFQSRSALLNA